MKNTDKMQHLLKRVVVTLITCLGIGTGNTASAQNGAPLENSLLWEISGNGLAAPSYIYGTIHMICDSDFHMADKVKRAFGKAARLVLEIDMFDPAIAAQMQEALVADTPLNIRLSPQRYALMDSLLQQQAGISLHLFDNYKLVALTSVLGRLSYTCDSLKVYEAEFRKMAMDKKIRVASLETLDEQMGFFYKAFPDDSILAQLTELDLQATREETATMVQYYRAEELEQVYKSVTEEKGMSKTALYWLLEVRNANWVKIMPAMMKEHSVFFAVGAGHLAGDKGIIRLLRAAGYTVKPVLH
jgi:uncharacterized protein YbaP (TraB family)